VAAMDWSLEAVRRDTPGVEGVVHFNNAGSALPPQVVVDTVIDHLRREAEIGGYEASAEAVEREEAVYTSVADLISAPSSQIALIENATRAWDMAVYGYPFRAGDRVLTARAEYASNVIALLQLRDRFGIEIVLVDDDEHGQISLDHLEAELGRGAEMVALTHVPTNGGLVNPAEAVGALCAAHGVFYVLDACQSVGQLPIDVAAIGCDVLSATGRKYLRAPRGTGFLYVSDRALSRLVPPFLDLHAATWTGVDTYEVRNDARRFENWETSHATKLGLGAAVDYALALGPDSTWARIEAVGATLRERLVEVDGVTVQDKGERRGGIVTFTVADRTADEVTAGLTAAGINTSVSPAEWAHFDLPERGLPALVRASVHYYNTDEEIDRLVRWLGEAPWSY
jgi:cysteine desulfurase / selenocysteine lyase